MTPRIFIADDEAPARERLKMLLSDIGDSCPHTVVGEAGDPRQALTSILAVQPDIAVLDVQMPGMSGIELARQLRLAGSHVAVIFVTAHDEFAVEAFEVHALDYLLKPIRASRLEEAIRRVVALRMPQDSLPPNTQARTQFSIQERGRTLLVPVADVVYLKAESKYVTLRTSAGEFLIEESLTSIEEELSAVFVRVHRNALVAKNAIAGVERGTHAVDGEEERPQESWQVILRGVEERLPISRRQWPAVKSLVR